MFECMLCFPVTGHEADFALVFGRNNSILRVCRYCLEDLTLFRFRARAVIRLETSKLLRTYPPVHNLLEAKP